MGNEYFEEIQGIQDMQCTPKSFITFILIFYRIQGRLMVKYLLRAHKGERVGGGGRS